MEEAKATKNSGTKRWMRDIFAMSNSYQFEGLEIVNISTEGDVCNVVFRTLLLDKQKEGNYIPIEENSTFLRLGGRWLYQDGESEEPDEDIAREMVEQWPSRGQKVDDTGDLSRPASIGGATSLPSLKNRFITPSQRPDKVAGSAGLSKETWAQPNSVGRHSR